MDFKLGIRRKFVAAKIQITVDELKYMEHRYDEFDGGKYFEAINPHLAGDFDLFGNGSLYQYINRCVTGVGSQLLASQLSHPETGKVKIAERQKAIEELSTKPDFIAAFRATGVAAGNTHDNSITGFDCWLNTPPENITQLKIISFVYPVLFFIQLLFVVFGIIPAGVFGISFVIAFGVVASYRKMINRTHNHLSKSGQMFEKYALLIRLIEKEKFRSPLLQQLHNRLHTGNEKPSHVIAQLYKLINRFDLRNNLVTALLFNFTCLFDLHVYRQLHCWHLKYGKAVSTWFDALAAIDAATGFACFAFNCSEEVSYPDIADGDFIFDATELAHPLIPPQTRVSNTVRFGGKPSVTVITGANMAGKSTFLRTVAVNLVLAQNGAPVLARRLVFTPCIIMSSINIRDSLKQKASYFYAELLRIKQIISFAETHPHTLVILDEILRGTNTKDKQAGAIGLLEKLMTLNANVIIATHDLAIGELATKYPSTVTNHCFEVELENDQLVFDYKLKNGISKKLNASFLMKRMGII